MTTAADLQPHIPSWVFFVLFGLLLLGWRQSRPRSVRPGTLLIVAAAMLSYSLYGVVTAFGGHAAALLAWALGVAVSIGFGHRALAPRGMVLDGERVHLPGSWLPMLLLMTIFGCKFALGYAAAVGAGLAQDATLAPTASLIFGLLSGAFAARATAVLRFAGHSGKPLIDAVATN